MRTYSPSKSSAKTHNEYQMFFLRCIVIPIRFPVETGGDDNGDKTNVNENGNTKRKSGENIISLGGGILGGGAGIVMLIQLIVNNNAVLTQHGDELVLVNQRVADLGHVAALIKANISRLDSKIVGRGPDGFHKQDWERERRVMDARLSQIGTRMSALARGIYDCQREHKDGTKGLGGMDGGMDH